jgi:hypothetical protein
MTVKATCYDRKSGGNVCLRQLRFCKSASEAFEELYRAGQIASAMWCWNDRQGKWFSVNPQALQDMLRTVSQCVAAEV